MKLGVITDGISRDVEYAFQVMQQTGITYGELQNIWDKEIGEQTSDELARLKELMRRYQIKISCITRHNFSDFRVLETDLNGKKYRNEIEMLKRSIEIGHQLGTRNIRVMVCKKEVNIWGATGADHWLTKNNTAWERFLEIYREPLQIAEAEDIDLVAETSNDGMITSGYLHKKFIEDLGSSHMKTLWDPANSIVGCDTPYPNGYEMIRDSVAEIHMKDIRSDRVHSWVEFSRMGRGQMAPYLHDIAAALRRDCYQGVIALESVHCPSGGSFEDGYRLSLPVFQEIFGD